jgi:DNA repair exonuclease SbcCD ATPase subunit
MFIRFDKLIFSNILSFGAEKTTIDFSQGFHLIVGQNGSGKSAILDALSYCLFGQPYRKIKIKELINRKNRSNTYVECQFTIDNTDKYTIIRQMKPDHISIMKNNQEIDLLSSKRLNQDEIDNIIGINYSMFKQVISLAVNYNKPFLSLPAMEKRDIVESIFNIKIFGQMMKIHKINNTDIRIKVDINDQSLKIHEENIKSLRKRVKELNDATTNFANNKNNDLKNLQDRIEQKNNTKNGLNNRISLNDKQLLDLEDLTDIDKLKSERENYINNINEKEYNVKRFSKNIDLISKNTVCTLCNQDITDDVKEKELKRLKLLIEKTNMAIIPLKNSREMIEKDIDIKEKKIKEKQNIENDNNKIKYQINMIDDELLHLLSQKNDIENRIIDFNIDSINAEFNLKIEEYKKMWKSNNLLKNKLKNNEVVSNILSENGIKSFLFKKLTPILNSKVNKYIQIFDLPVRIDFDEYMNERITNIENLRRDVSYYAYSEGEKKRIDTAILLAFIDVTKSICNWRSNVIIFDELLDSAVDDTGLDKMISCLKQISQADGMCGYVISHRLHDANGFSSRYEITKDSIGFSNISKL